ncbi:hypothetical protein FE391_39510 [Nonomuraea sp. KC401]|uniref:hypothetical protein n=1 Tax=unclassified Nonomuraea TaxID=2593643 RepID=UPI0010FF1D97|nr:MULTISPECIES: hypothetical protein [unclassified Nonomuraea]NBE95412.1 hypothetical protein [Nonomuraea sp. K271]TLF56389.1 hypothetical protein FE391_39510 [Nonomuraea sp. KC401]
MTTIGTTARARSTGREDAVLAAGIAMIAVQLIWKFALVRRTYFRQDDFHFIARGLEQGMSWDYLMRVDFGHLMPGPFAIHWVMGRLGVYNDLLAHTVTIGLLAAAGLALLRLLHVLFGARPAILVPLAFYLLTPMTLSALSWWAVVVETLPFQVALPMALGSHVLYVRSGRFRHAVSAAAWTVLAMAFFVKAPFILLLAFVLTLGWFPRADRRPAWLLYLTLIAIYAAIFFQRLSASVTLTNDAVRPALPDPATAAGFTWQLLTSLVSTALGGPWAWQPIGDDYAIAATPQALVWAGLAVAVAVVAASVRYRRTAWLAWLTLLAYFLLADVVPVAIGRIVQLGPDLGGLELRYVSSTASVLALVIGLAFLPLRGEERPWLRPLPRLRHAWIPLGALIAAGSLWSAAAYARLPLGDQVRSYVETARLALKRVPSGSVILDTHVPGKVAHAMFFYDYARVSKLLGPLAAQPVTWTRRLTGPVPRPLAFDGQGRLRPVVISGVRIPQRDGCTRISGKETRLRLPAPVRAGEWTVQVGYLNPKSAELSVRLGDGTAAVRAGSGFGWTFAPVRGGGGEVRLRTLDGGTACVGEIRIGVPVPAEDAAAIPPDPVTR